MRLLTIAEASRELGVHQNTLRRWSDAGLIPVTRLPSGYRRWSPEQIEEIKTTMLAPKETAA